MIRTENLRNANWKYPCGMLLSGNYVFFRKIFFNEIKVMNIIKNSFHILNNNLSLILPKFAFGPKTKIEKIMRSFRQFAFVNSCLSSEFVLEPSLTFWLFTLLPSALVTQPLNFFLLTAIDHSRRVLSSTPLTSSTRSRHPALSLSDTTRRVRPATGRHRALPVPVPSSIRVRP